MSIDYRRELFHYFPNGKIVGHDFYIGNTRGEKGSSLRINIDKGLWIDASTGEKGNFFQLLAIFQNKTIKQVLSDYGIERIHRRYLAERGICDNSVSKYKITYQNNTVSFPSYTEDGKLNCIKHLCLPVEAKKRMFLAPKPQLKGVWFGWQAYKGQLKTIITEGEIDALTWDTILTAHGIDQYCVMSLPNGIGYINNEAIRLLNKFENIFLSFDYDKDTRLLEETETAYAKFVAILGGKVRRIPQLDFRKDVNEAWKNNKDTSYYVRFLNDMPYKNTQLSVKDKYFNNYWSCYLPILATTNASTFYDFAKRQKPMFYWGREILDINNHVCLDDPFRAIEYFKFIRTENRPNDIFMLDLRGIMLHSILYQQILEYIKSIQGKLFILVSDINQYFFNLEV